MMAVNYDGSTWHLHGATVILQDAGRKDQHYDRASLELCIRCTEASRKHYMDALLYADDLAKWQAGLKLLGGHVT
jgi:hypothetical protein